MCSQPVNAARISVPFNAVTIWPMEDRPVHESAQRLLDAARLATSALPLDQRATDWPSLRNRLAA